MIWRVSDFTWRVSNKSAEEWVRMYCVWRVSNNIRAVWIYFWEVWPEEWVIMYCVWRVSNNIRAVWIYFWEVCTWRVSKKCMSAVHIVYDLHELAEYLKSDRQFLSEEWVIMHINGKFLGVLTIWRIPGNLDKERSAKPGKWPEEWVTSGKCMSRRSIYVHTKLLFNPLYMKNFWEFWQFGGISRTCF
jgi:hypothetical protein